MSTPTPATQLYQQYANVVSQLRDPAVDKATIDSSLKNIRSFIVTQIPKTDKKVTLKNHEFVTLLINYPSIWLKIVLTYVFWITLDEKILSETIKNLFKQVDLAQNAALKTKLFSYNRFASNDDLVKTVAENWYIELIYNVYQNDKYGIEAIKGVLDNMIRIADLILESNAGSKARAACEASARGTTLFHYLKLMGCLSGLVAPGPECDAIKEALKNLIESAEDLDL